MTQETDLLCGSMRLTPLERKEQDLGVWSAFGLVSRWLLKLFSFTSNQKYSNSPSLHDRC